MTLAATLEPQIGHRAFVVLSNAGIGSDAELYAMMRQFPSIADDPEIYLPALSNLVATRMSITTRAVVESRVVTPVRFATGSKPPPDSVASIGFRQDPVTLPPPLNLDTTLVSCGLTTLVRDQGDRGTCVAQAVTACVEEYHGHADLSEQFLYWGAKLHGGDPYPSAEGTWLRCAEQALAVKGICSEQLWPYNPAHILGNETHEVIGAAPSAAALSDAQSHVHTVSICSDVSAMTSGKASYLRTELAKGPVAISLPVFKDPQTPFDNWSWFGAVDHGHVLDPTQYSVVTAGHAICACGYYPSASAPGGGWFVFKNSWGTTSWNAGGGTVPPGHPVTPPGYGYVSASYVDRYLWEYLRA